MFKDRVEAGINLASALPQAEFDIVIVVAKGGIPVGKQISNILKIPLKVTVVRKIPIPGNPEAGMGAVDETGYLILNHRLIAELGLRETEIQKSINSVKREIARRASFFRDWLKSGSLDGLKVILTDDGLASGYTMLAAIKSVRGAKASQVTVAVPTTHFRAKQLVALNADKFVSLIVETKEFFAGADYYEHWKDLTDKEAMDYLEDD